MNIEYIVNRYMELNDNINDKCTEYLKIICNNFPYDSPDKDSIEDINSIYSNNLYDLWDLLSVFCDLNNCLSEYNNTTLDSINKFTENIFDNILNNSIKLVYLIYYNTTILHMIISKKYILLLNDCYYWKNKEFVNPLHCLYISKILNLIYRHFNRSVTTYQLLKNSNIPYDWKIDNNILESIINLRVDINTIILDYEKHLYYNLNYDIPLYGYFDDNEYIKSEIEENIFNFHREYFNKISKYNMKQL